MSKKPDTDDQTHHLWTPTEQRTYEAMMEYHRHPDYYEGMPDHPSADDEALDRWRAAALDWSRSSRQGA